VTAHSDDHVVEMGGGVFACLHCGQKYGVALPAPIDIVVATSRAFVQLHRGCVAPRAPRCSACLAEGHTLEQHHELVTLRAPDPQSAWFASGDTGISSMAIWRHMRSGDARDGRWGANIPLDPSDFGRCYRLLAAFPAWRLRIGEMARYSGWAPLVARWEDLERLYVEELPSGEGPRLYALMRELGERAAPKDFRSGG
jgi:hypothetical protein